LFLKETSNLSNRLKFWIEIDSTFTQLFLPPLMLLTHHSLISAMGTNLVDWQKWETEGASPTMYPLPFGLAYQPDLAS
jgi:hypothetical protein